MQPAPIASAIDPYGRGFMSMACQPPSSRSISSSSNKPSQPRSVSSADTRERSSGDPSIVSEKEALPALGCHVRPYRDTASPSILPSAKTPPNDTSAPGARRCTRTSAPWRSTISINSEGVAAARLPDRRRTWSVSITERRGLTTTG